MDTTPLCPSCGKPLAASAPKGLSREDIPQSVVDNELDIFRTRSLSAANGVMLLAAGGLFAFFFFSTLYVQLILGYSPLEAGLAFLPVAVGIGIGAALAGQLVKRIGVRSTTVIGMLMAAFGLWLFSRAPVDGSYLSHVFPAIIPQSLGMGPAIFVGPCGCIQIGIVIPAD